MLWSDKVGVCKVINLILETAKGVITIIVGYIMIKLAVDKLLEWVSRRRNRKKEKKEHE